MVMPNLPSSRYDPASFEQQKGKVWGDAIYSIGNNLGSAIIKHSSPEYQLQKAKLEEFKSNKTSIANKKRYLAEGFVKEELDAAKPLPEGQRGEYEEYSKLSEDEQKDWREKRIQNYLKKFEGFNDIESLTTIAKNWATTKAYQKGLRHTAGSGTKLLTNPTMDQLADKNYIKELTEGLDRFAMDGMDTSHAELFNMYQQATVDKPEERGDKHFNNWVRDNYAYGLYVEGEDMPTPDQAMGWLGKKHWAELNESAFARSDKEKQAQKDRMEQINGQAQAKAKADAQKKRDEHLAKFKESVHEEMIDQMDKYDAQAVSAMKQKEIAKANYFSLGREQAAEQKEAYERQNAEWDTERDRAKLLSALYSSVEIEDFGRNPANELKGLATAIENEDWEKIFKRKPWAKLVGKIQNQQQINIVPEEAVKEYIAKQTTPTEQSKAPQTTSEEQSFASQIAGPVIEGGDKIPPNPFTTDPLADKANINTNQTPESTNQPTQSITPKTLDISTLSLEEAKQKIDTLADSDFIIVNNKGKKLKINIGKYRELQDKKTGQ